MTLHHFSASNISDYQAFVNAHCDATPYHNLAWGLAVNKSYGFDMQYMGLIIDTQLVAVMPAILMTTLSAKKTICSLPYCDMGGILALSPDNAHKLKQLVTEFANKQKYQFEYRDTLRSDASIPDNAKTDNNHGDENISEGTKVRMLYTLLSDIDAQMASFKPKLRSQIKKAMKNGITSNVIANPSQHDLKQFYQAFAINMRDLGSPVHSINWFEGIFSEYKDNAFLVLVQFEDKCVGGAIVIHNSTKAVIPWASTLRDYNKLAPNMLLYWSVLSEVIGRGISHFDFGRSAYNEGTFRFKKQWGAQPLPLKWESLVDKQLTEETMSGKSPLRTSIENMWQKMPIGFTTSVGPKIRKFISL